MCIVIDANALAAVFRPDNAEHDRYEPVFQWIMERSG